MKSNNIYYNNFFLTTYKIMIISLLVTFITILRYLLIFIPNIELVTFFLMICVVCFIPSISFMIINIFCIIQIILFGIPDLAYFYIYNLYGLIVLVLKKLLIKFSLLFTFIIFLFGLFFGFLYAVEIFFMFNLTYALTYWLYGLIFDLIHAVGNAFFSLLFYKYLINVFQILSMQKTFLFNNTFIHLLKNS